MRADEQFKIGDRVIFRPEGWPEYSRKRGEVTGFSEYREAVLVRFEGKEYSCGIHMSYLDKVEE